MARDITKKKRRKYIPGLASFRFRPEPDYSHAECKELYQSPKNDLGKFKEDRVYYADCIKSMKELPGVSIDQIIADPPFGLEFTGKESVYNRDGGLVADGYQEVDIGDYWKFSEEWISCLPRIMKKDSNAFIFSGWTNLEAVMAAVRKAGLETINHLVWKYQFGVFTNRRFVSSHYHILFVVKDKDEYYYHKMEHYPEDVWLIKRKYRKGLQKNGTVLPVDVIRKCIEFSSVPGDVVLDPFMGNATTAMAAKGLWRHFLGFEINKGMRQIIKSNIASMGHGSIYRTYDERFPDILRGLKKKYPRAYKIWKIEAGQQISEQSPNECLNYVIQSQT